MALLMIPRVLRYLISPRGNLVIAPVNVTKYDNSNCSSLDAWRFAATQRDDS